MGEKVIHAYTYKICLLKPVITIPLVIAKCGSRTESTLCYYPRSNNI